MFTRRRPENADADLDFDIKSQVGKELKQEWLRYKSSPQDGNESLALQPVMEMLHQASFIPPGQDVPWRDSVPGAAPRPAAPVIGCDKASVFGCGGSSTHDLVLC